MNEISIGEMKSQRYRKDTNSPDKKITPFHNQQSKGLFDKNCIFWAYIQTG